MGSDLQYCSILGTNINVTDMEETLSYIGTRLEELRGAYICVSNVHTTVMAYEDEAYRLVQNSAAMALPDGKPLSLVSRRRGFPRAERVSGPDLMPKLLERSAAQGWSHYFYGGRPETLALLRKKLQERFPAVRIAGMEAPPFRPPTWEEDEQTVERIRAARPDFIWVGLGAPKQENWMYGHRGKLPGLMIGVGAAFDFYAGTVKRAPQWMQSCSLEWLYRLLQDPKRLWKRYVVTNSKFVWYLMRGK